MCNRVWVPRLEPCWLDPETLYPRQYGAVKLWVGGCGRLVYLQQLERCLYWRWWDDWRRITAMQKPLLKVGSLYFCL